MSRGRCAHARDRRRRFRQRLTPQRIDVGMLACDCDRRIRRTAEVDRNVRFLNRLYVREGANELVVLALMIDWLVRRPHAAKNFDILVGALIALVMRDEIAVLALLAVVTARDDMHREPAAAEMIERRQLARCHSGRYEA